MSSTRSKRTRRTRANTWTEGRSTDKRSRRTFISLRRPSPATTRLGIESESARESVIEIDAIGIETIGIEVAGIIRRDETDKDRRRLDAIDEVLIEIGIGEAVVGVERVVRALRLAVEGVVVRLWIGDRRGRRGIQTGIEEIEVLVRVVRVVALDRLVKCWTKCALGVFYYYYFYFK